MKNSQVYQNLYVVNSLSVDSSIVNNILIKLQLYVRRYHTRQQLKKLSPEQLCDVGISKEQMLEESQKPFWD